MTSFLLPICNPSPPQPPSQEDASENPDTSSDDSSCEQYFADAEK